MSRHRQVVLLATAAFLTLLRVLLWLEDRPPVVVRDPPSAARTADAERPVEAPIPADRPAAPEGAANVVLAVLSTQRRDQWSVYGGPPTTPFLAERAAQGAVMSDGLAVAVSNAPALSAILTGRYPHALGAVDPTRADRAVQLRADAETLAERLGASGWHTIGLTAAAEIARGRGLEQGFDQFADLSTTPATASEVVEAALARIDARPAPAVSQPLFLLVVLDDSRHPGASPPAAPLADPQRPWVGPYRATVLQQDEALASLVRGLADRGIDEKNTVFAVLSDHGEGLKIPKRHRLRHGIVLYQSAVAIPWLWWGRGIVESAQISGLASQVDLAPTLVALAGGGAFVGDGLDWSDALRSGARTARQTGRTEAYADTFAQGFNRASLWTADRQCQRDYGSTNRPPDDDFDPGCFDRRADPDFTRPLAATPAVTASLSRLDVLHLERTRAIATTDPHPPGSEP